MVKFEDMSRDELVETAKSMHDNILRCANTPFLNQCPFCFGTGVVPGIKAQCKEDVIAEWRKDVTHEENEAYFKKMTELFTGK